MANISSGGITFHFESAHEELFHEIIEKMTASEDVTRLQLYAVPSPSGGRRVNTSPIGCSY